MNTRRNFLKLGGAALASAATLSSTSRTLAAAGREYKIAIDGWSMHKEVFAGTIKQVDIFKVCREEFGIDAFNLVNNMLEVPTADYVRKLAMESAKHKVTIPLIIIDSEGSLGHMKKEERDKAVRNHTKWVWIANDLGCTAIRVNWGGGNQNDVKDDAKLKDLIDRSAEA